MGLLEFYSEVDDLDALWNSMKYNLEGIKIVRTLDRGLWCMEVQIGIPHTLALMSSGQEIIR